MRGAAPARIRRGAEIARGGGRRRAPWRPCAGRRCARPPRSPCRTICQAWSIRPAKLIFDQCRGARGGGGRRCGRQRRPGRQETDTGRPRRAHGPCLEEGWDGLDPLAAVPAAPAHSAATVHRVSRAHCPSRDRRQRVVASCGRSTAGAARRGAGGQAPRHRRIWAAPAARYARRPGRAAFSALRAAFHALTCALAMARFSGSAMRLRSDSPLLRRRPSARHGLEQYLTERLVVENFLPHSLQPTRSTLAISLSALAVHFLQ